MGIRTFALGVLFFGFLLAPAEAQLAGSRGGATNTAAIADSPPLLSRQSALGFITIEGRVELRVRPTQIRIVFALTGLGKTPAECRKTVAQQEELLRQAWTAAGIPDKDIVSDFIAILPRYEFESGKKKERDIIVEKRTGYRMQSNIHLAVRDDTAAMEALRIAFEKGIAHIIAFDYWSDRLDEAKRKARSLAVKEAREKADLLLGELFEKKPQIANVQESTKAYFPGSLYHSFENAVADQYINPFGRHGVPAIRAFRPRNTYYRGLDSKADVQPKEMAMRAEISVVSTVRLYFESPSAARGEREKGGRNTGKE